VKTALPLLLLGGRLWTTTSEVLMVMDLGENYQPVKPDGTDPRRFETPTARKREGYGMYSESPDGTMIASRSWNTKDKWRQSIRVMRISDGASLFLTTGEKKSLDAVPWWGEGVKE
jgi:hypothetical protein